jgi:hypothetical protein
MVAYFDVWPHIRAFVHVSGRIFMLCVCVCVCVYANGGV